MTWDRYARSRDDLPWGWWLRANPQGLEDADGRVWRDVRTAFWEGRLGMPGGRFAADQQELLLRVLTSIEANWASPVEAQHDLFGGDMLFWRFYMGWLCSTGLLGQDGSGAASFSQAVLGVEGRAVLAMLRATRAPAFVDLPMADLVLALHRFARGAADEAREAALRAFESGMTALPHIFARERVGRSHLVTLTSLDRNERMPVRRVVWSASFLDPSARDDLSGWLAVRVHRWEDWGGIARSDGAKDLSDHLLALLVVAPIGRGSEGGA